MTTAEALIHCTDINAALEFYVEQLGFRVDSIFPAESPTVAVVRGYGLRLRLDPNAPHATVSIRISSTDLDSLGGAGQHVAPDGTVVNIVDADPPLELPPLKQSFVLERASNEANWTVGRAGMRYRDLIPDRQGGRFVGSHIQIPNAGPVPDYVHFHKIRFQMIYCYKGWVRLVYEDQGEPFIMNAGDCVLQPPRIRHRVLESSAGLEVVEIGCPALHETFADPETDLPTKIVNPDRDFGGQRYAYHRANTETWSEVDNNFERRRFGFFEATDGLAEASVLRSTGPHDGTPTMHHSEFHFLFVLTGNASLQRDGEPDEALVPADSFVMPSHQKFALTHRSADLELLEVSLPGTR
jgi:quercetin dioxygenase-like cupin family protein